MGKLQVLYLSMRDVEKASVGMDQIKSTLKEVYLLKGREQMEKIERL